MLWTVKVKWAKLIKNIDNSHEGREQVSE